MIQYPPQIKNLIESFAKLPGIGRKTAERFVFYLIKQEKEELYQFANHLAKLHEANFTCPQCFNFSPRQGLCDICGDEKRDKTTLCVVEEFHDLSNIENTKLYNGLYHVLGGKIDPPSGMTADRLKIRELIKRIQTEQITEIILALNPDIQGEGTILYLRKELLPLNVRLTLLARGLPMGGNIEYADEVTLSNALKGRQALN
ncbi:recombination protein RecR [Candidatus Falkowbacteria bacterium]|jgi:recombination protein RecR|nr:recombination protein RecR [Candidatus Falkowbacteria bacterium]MBT7007169.1 recombination protein RecR [Candidatus Falkowbacteria bacterium]